MDRHIPVTGEIYRHFKNKLYQIVTVATHSETGERLVIYQALYGDYTCCARPLDMFLGRVDKAKYPESLQEYRFELVDKNSLEKIHSEAESGAVSEEGTVNQDLLNFLDADTYEEKKNLLVSMRRKMTDELIDSIAASLDISVDDGELDKRYISLYNCVSTMAKYEVNNRLR
ncbi:MAG: DUF1653 domain-containing protein [Lachnospiraceae bacterium]|nr:DUF1653 domain-containing protein [Lachnospiraceae bacterium]MDE6698642.1 DUF1653 domain-containing protein [Lachnospiraceae bacterium]